MNASYTSARHVGRVDIAGIQLHSALAIGYTKSFLLLYSTAHWRAVLKSNQRNVSVYAQGPVVSLSLHITAGLTCLETKTLMVT